MIQAKSDAIFWEKEIYSRGRHLNKYPFDAVVSFIYRWCSTKGPFGDQSVLEIGCGSGNNLWFAAREGFKVHGIDQSPTAISFAQERFVQESLTGEFRVGSFLDLPWADSSVDAVIDRCSTTCVGIDAQRAAVSEVKRVLRPGAFFFFNGYSDKHTSSTSGDVMPDGRITNIRAGTLVGVGDLLFSSRSQIDHLFSDGWELVNLEHIESLDCRPGGCGIHAEWRAVARKV